MAGSAQSGNDGQETSMTAILFCIRNAARSAMIGSAIVVAGCASVHADLNSGIPGPISTPPNTSSGNGTGTATASSPQFTLDNVFVPYSDYTGLMGSVGAPAPGSFGASPVPAQLAAPDGSSFETANNTLFRVLATSFQATPTGLNAAASNQSATITFTSTGTGSYIDPCWGTTETGMGAQIQLSIPSVGVKADLSTPDIRNVDVSYTTGFNYVLLGAWAADSSTPASLQSLTWFVFGYETPPASMPASGQASFAGTAEGSEFTTSAGNISTSSLRGSASFSAEFTTGKISGAFTNMQAYATGTSGPPFVGGLQWWPWNDVSISATIAGGTTKFSGTTAVTSSAPGP
jgi:hypothetical protein